MVLQIKDIHKQYKTGDFVQKALDGVTLNLRDNEFVAILGPSGSGKTTLLNIIGGLDRYDSGDLVINGTSTKQYRDRDWDSYRNHTIGFVFQSYNLIPHQSILANVELALTISGIPRSQRRQRARRALAQVGLGAHVHKKPNQLSGGQMQRVAIARALVNDPDIVLADEPTGALDSDTSVQIMDLLKEVARDRLVVMVTHNPDLAEQYATRIVNLRDGRIVDDSDPYVIDEAESEPAVHRTMGKASMSFGTAVALSFNNLRTKMARTILTSFAGSIGIIGIALILSVSTGVNNYITAIQRDTMTAYPISIDAKSWDLQSLLEESAANANGERTKDHKHDAVYADDSSFTQASTLTSSIAENNLTAFKQYLDDPDSEIQQYVGSNGIHYSYDVKFSVISRDPNGTLVNADGVDFGDDTGSMSSMMATKSGSMSSMSDVTAMQMSMVTGETDENAAPSSFGEIMPGESDSELISPVVTDNYKVVSGTWPAAQDEVVLVADQNNEIPLSTLYELGLLPASDYDDLMKRLDDGEKIDEQTIRLDYDQVLNQQLYLIPACDQYVRGDDGLYSYVGDDAERMAELVDNGTAMPLKIVGVVRPVEDADAANIDGSVGYTHALTGLSDRPYEPERGGGRPAGGPDAERAQRHDVLALGRRDQGRGRPHLRRRARCDAEGAVGGGIGGAGRPGRYGYGRHGRVRRRGDDGPAARRVSGYRRRRDLRAYLRRVRLHRRLRRQPLRLRRDQPGRPRARSGSTATASRTRTGSRTPSTSTTPTPPNRTRSPTWTTWAR